MAVVGIEPPHPPRIYLLDLFRLVLFFFVLCPLVLRFLDVVNIENKFLSVFII